MSSAGHQEVGGASRPEAGDSGVDLKACTSPLAFTVNFDEDNEDEEDRRNNNNSHSNNHTPKKQPPLNLKDGFNRFSPKHRLSSSATKTHSVRSSKDPPSSRGGKDPDEDSDTGTYTIEDEEEENDSKGSSWEEDADKSIPTSRDEDWISRWAEEQARQQQKIRQAQNVRRSTPPSSSNLSEENCRFRRKLPRLPASNASNDSSRDTEDLLKDTLSVVVAMEARIEESDKRKVSSSPVKKKPDPKEAAKLSELEAWKRRKNYRPAPLCSVPPKLRSNAPGRMSSSASEGGGRITRAALRQQSNNNPAKNNSNNASSSKKPCKNASSSGPGRSTSSMSSKDAEFQAWKRRKNYNPLQAVANSKNNSKKKNSGSLSHLLPPQDDSNRRVPSSEAEFESERTLRSLQGLKVSSSNSLMMPPRSASFHYPTEGGNVHYTSDEDYEEEECESLDYEESSSQLGKVGGAKKTMIQQLSKEMSSNPRHSSSASAVVGGGGGSSSKVPGFSSSSKNHQKLEALDNLVISTIFSVSTKLCISSQNLLQKVRTSDLELSSIIDTLLYVLDDTDPPVSPSKKTSRELSGTLRNLKKVEQVLQVLERLHSEEESPSCSKY